MVESKGVRENVLKLRQEDPGRSASDMAREIGCSRERVRQILKTLNLPTTSAEFRRKYYCENPKCGKELSGSGRTTRRHCSRKCYSDASRVDVVCAECGIVKSVINSQYKYKIAHGQKVWYCSRTCLGTWLGREHGRGVQYVREQNVKEGFSWKRILRIR